MWSLTPAERRALLLIALLYLAGGLWDVWRARRPAPSLAQEAAPSSAVAPVQGRLTPPGAGEVVARSEQPAGRLQLNRADEPTLDRLPGIGPVLARRIVEHRRAHGPFRSVEELAAVRGIGPRLLDRLRPLVTTDSL
jgi:competence protein ComEA